MRKALKEQADGKKRKAQVLQAVDEVFEDKSLDAQKARDVCQFHVGKCGCSEVLAYLEKLNLPGMVIPEHLEGKNRFALARHVAANLSAKPLKSNSTRTLSDWCKCVCAGLQAGFVC